MTRQRYPSDNVETVLLRLPNGMRDRLREIARSNRRSVSNQVVVILERTIFNQPETEKGSEVSA